MEIIKKIADKSNDLQNLPAPCIAFFGDSVTEGSMKEYHDFEAVYHNRIRKIFNVLFPDTPVNIINAGIGGTTAQFGVVRLERDILSKNPDLCVVAFGLNDCSEADGALETYVESLREIFTKLQAAGIEVIFMTPNMMNTRFYDDAVNWDYAHVTMERMKSGLFDKFIDAARKLAGEFDIPVCDCYAKWKKLEENGVNTTKLLINGINHPKPEMHMLFAYSLVETMMTN